MLSKHLDMSPSMNHCVGWASLEIIFRAVWQLLLGRNPWELSLNRGSKMASRTSLNASCTILSTVRRGGAIDSGLVPTSAPDAFGICIILTPPLPPYYPYPSSAPWAAPRRGERRSDNWGKLETFVSEAGSYSLHLIDRDTIQGFGRNPLSHITRFTFNVLIGIRDHFYTTY
jgi:hypothetical protein